MTDPPERRPRRFGRFEEHGEVIPSGPVRPLSRTLDPLVDAFRTPEMRAVRVRAAALISGTDDDVRS